jgi:hypothetical protein
MAKFGAGFGKDWGPENPAPVGRPCRSVNSATRQKYFSRRLETDIYNGQSFPEPRPTWWRNDTDQIYRVPSPSRLGEWKLVWCSKGPDGSARGTRSGLGRDQQRPVWGPQEVYHSDGPLLHNYAHINRDSLKSRGPSRASSSWQRERTVGSRQSPRPHSSLRAVGEHGALSLGSAFEGVGAERQGAESLDINKRQGTAVSQRSHVSQMSHHSRASRASTRHSDLSWRSTDSLNSSMILERSCFEPCRVANPCHQTSPAFLPPLAP